VNLWGWLGMADNLSKPIEALGNLYTKDKDRLNADNEFQKIVQNPNHDQLRNNRILAMSALFFNNGWQSLTGWTAGFLILVYYFPQIIITEWIWAHECFAKGTVVPFPLPVDNIMQLVYLLFGFGVHSLAKRRNP
jgi:hypothetical protein